MKRVQLESYPVSIFIAGSPDEARKCCDAFCDDVGLCVTLTETKYRYTGGHADGVIVGLINYPRFPSTPDQIWARAETLAQRLCERLWQESYTIQAPDKTEWFSHRPEDASVTGTGTAKTAQPVEGEACQNGPQGDAPDTSPPSSPQAG